jgi:hypothetical protein
MARREAVFTEGASSNPNPFQGPNNNPIGGICAASTLARALRFLRKQDHMRTNWTQLLGAAVIGLSATFHTSLAQAPATPQALITGKAFLNITGTAVANLTNVSKFPNAPDAMFFFPYFEWNAGGDISVPAAQFGDNYGGQIVGYFYPPATGDYVFYLAADDNAVLYLSPTANAADKKVIARETVWSNAREYTISGGASDLTAKDTSQYLATEWPTKDPGTGAAKITLQANQPYYIEALFKEGTGGDYLSVAVLDPGGTIDSTAPIPGQYLSSDRTNGPVSIVTQPQSQTAPERGSVTFSVLANGTPPYSFQWRRNGADILDATNINYTLSNVQVTDSTAQFSVVVTGGQGTVTSDNAILTVAPDTAPPTIVTSKASPGGTELVVTFSEPVDLISGGTASNYQISSVGGPLNVTGATVSASGTQVILATAQQTLGTKYTLVVNNVKDTAATPNTIAPNSTSVFFPTGKIIESNGLIVIEAENWDRNTDDRWIRDTTRGIPSGGAYAILPNGAGGNTDSKIEYDVDFAQAATYTVWIRASADNGNDDSVWFYLDNDGDGITEPPVGRELSNDASLTGFQPFADFVWRSDAQSGTDPFTIDIPAAGPRAIALARREDGAAIDKIIITTQPGYTPTGFGPPETREGAPGLPTVTLTSPTAGQTFSSGANINLAATAAGQSGLNITRIQYTANGTVIGESTTSPFNVTWTNVPAGVFGLRAIAYDELGQSTTSDSVAITVGNPAPNALFVIGTDSIPNLNPSDAAIKARLETNGWQVTVVQAPASTTSSADGKQLIIISSTVASGDVAAKFRDSTVPALMWEQAVQDDFLMTLNVDGTDRGTQTGQTQINIVNTSHPLAAGLPLGILTATTNAVDYSYGLPNSNAVIIATMVDNPNRAVIYGYDKGAPLINGTPAPARRVLIFPSNNAFVDFTPDAVKLFDAAVQWASGITPKPPGARIAWISFHSADETPSTAAATAGFTNAADVAYTRLLEEAGHEVTRFRTSGTPDTNVLNTFDLVIISRSVPSGDYQDPPETLAWNSAVTAPTMILGGYIIRQNRLGFMTGSTIPDTTNSIKLTITDTNHPIFAGISVDASGTMLNDYANIATYTNNPQRGISVVTGPVATGGEVLATVGTPEDPTFGGMIIAEFPAGNVLANGTANTLGGDRLVFLTGSRESATPALTSEGSGIFDLTPDGTKMFLNAVNYMAGLTGPTEPEPPALAITRNAGGGITITFEGTLESSTSLAPANWTTESSTSPLQVTPDLPMKFYRARR